MKLVETFRQHENAWHQLAAALIRARHSNNLPRGTVGAMAIIKGEMAKKRAHMPIRKLMQRAGPTGQKTCLPDEPNLCGTVHSAGWDGIRPFNY
jgi:hypothetical protein